ncbi:hypothetical protein BKA66DRAFT_448246 [Pyrenochaeta sp. MPI-SDFR-AT-0127]|nr:hypothetical protein BKA66DRAFT_448246 [Pyrenochaeta sp. MPI-SDFR-AT-0127]
MSNNAPEPVLSKYRYEVLFGLWLAVTGTTLLRISRQPYSTRLKIEQYESIFKGQVNKSEDCWGKAPLPTCRFFFPFVRVSLFMRSFIIGSSTKAIETKSYRVMGGRRYGVRNQWYQTHMVL